MAKTKYTLTDEHRAQLGPWAEKWIRNALSTKPMDDADRAAMVDAVHGLYDAAHLPRPKAVVFVPSPLVGQVSAAFAAAICYERRTSPPDATWAATRDATEAATWAATSDATWAATSDATWAATEAATSDATSDATRDATWAATRDATSDATSDATRDATWAATRDATSDATSDATWAATEAATWDATWAVHLSIRIGGAGMSDLMLSCARSAWRLYNGGNMWSWWPAFISFFRHVARLDLPEYEQWKHYEAAAIHGGFRWVHPDFCIVSDRPIVLRIDESSRPHCADGPSHLWSDGFRIYHWHGMRLPESHCWIITDPSRITAESIQAEPNAELRRVMLERTGFRPVLDRATVVAEDADGNGHRRRLLAATISGEPVRMVEVQNGSLEPDGSRKTYVLGAMPGNTPHECIAASYGINPARYREAVRT